MAVVEQAREDSVAAAPTESIVLDVSAIVLTANVRLAAGSTSWHSSLALRDDS
ncbi:MAG: hypothetical protein ABSG43_10025 [Solirubrobacteraceae bacterium]|jgi:hypothetical protein